MKMDEYLDNATFRLTFRASPKMKLIDFEIPYKFIDKMIKELEKGKQNIERNYGIPHNDG